MPTPVSREYRIYLALWRKALKSPEPVRIRASCLSMAIAMRQGMYRAIRPFRVGQANDEELLQASEKFVVYLNKGELASDPHFLVLNERMALSELEMEFDLLGIDEEDLLLGDERNIANSLKHLIDGAPAEPVPLRFTPFFTRED